MGKRKRRCVRPLSEDKKEDVSGVHIDDLPEEMLLKILGYLKHNELYRVGRVCKKWLTITRSPFFWTRVDACISQKRSSLRDEKMDFIGVLPACVTHLRLSFEHSEDKYLNVKKLANILHQNCPNIQVLVFHWAILDDSFVCQSDKDKQLLTSIHTLAIPHCTTEAVMDISKLTKLYQQNKRLCMYYPFSCFTNSQNLEKLCMARSNLCDYIFEFYPSILSHLSVLDVEGASICPKSFEAICNYGQHLVELFVCCTTVSDDELVFAKSSKILPCVKIVCLRNTSVTCKGISALLKSCKTLQEVDVGNCLNDPSYDYSMCRSKKVHINQDTGHCHHYYYTKQNYMGV